MQEDELAEVHVDGEHHSVFRGRELQKCPVAGIYAELIGEQNVVALVNQPVGKPLSGTRIYKEPHPLPTDTAARESPATTACA